ncbi:hypothetical protein HYX12_03070 [Candidatus Woesearchaeota archaeon]|nr:hypothetical protein [Candidatus Woesearchaeota archaeon]
MDKDAQQITLQQKVNLQSLQLQQRYIDSGIADCNALNHILETNINELARKGEIIVGYEKKAVLNPNEFNLQLQDYFLTEIQFLLLSQEIDRQCQQDSVKIIYFYDENELDTQGDILDYLKKLFKERVLVFSFNSKFNVEPMISTLLTSYNITAFPAVVVDRKVFQGHTNLEVLKEAICSDFLLMKSKVPKECEIR